MTVAIRTRDPDTGTMDRGARRRPGRSARLAVGASIAAVSLAVSGGLALAVGEEPAAGRGEGSPEFVAVVATDLHYLAPGLNDGGAAFERFQDGGDGKETARAPAILDAFIREIAALGPDFLVLTGDLTNNGEKASHLEMAEKLRGIEASGVEVLVVPGNHDVANPWARRFSGEAQYAAEGLSAAGFARVYRDFGYGQALSRDPGTLSYVAAPAPGLRLLMLDANLYDRNAASGRPAREGRIAEGTMKWIEAQLTRARAEGARTIAALHHSVLDHSDRIVRGYTLDNGAEVARLLWRLGVRIVLTGHVHIQDASAMAFETGTLYDIATNALSVHPHQYGVLRGNPSSGRAEYATARVDVSAWARASGSADPYLLDFARRSEAAFRARAAAMVGFASADPSLSPAQAASMAQAMGTLNLRYFAGREYLNAADLAGSEGYRLLIARPGAFLADYAASILADPGTDDNELRVAY